MAAAPVDLVKKMKTNVTSEEKEPITKMQDMTEMSENQFDTTFHNYGLLSEEEKKKQKVKKDKRQCKFVRLQES